MECVVYGFEPTLQRSGALRIDINVEWSDELGRRVVDRFGEGASAALRRLFETRFDSDAQIYRTLRETQVYHREQTGPQAAIRIVYMRLDSQCARPDVDRGRDHADARFEDLFGKGRHSN